MSCVTNVVIFASILEELDQTETYPAIDALNERLHAISYGAFFKEVSRYAGGNKVMERRVFLAAFGTNYDEAAFLSALRSTQWNDADSLQVFVSQHEQERFLQIFGPSTQVVPAP